MAQSSDGGEPFVSGLFTPPPSPVRSAVLASEVAPVRTAHSSKFHGQVPQEAWPVDEVAAPEFLGFAQEAIDPFEPDAADPAGTTPGAPLFTSEQLEPGAAADSCA